MAYSCTDFTDDVLEAMVNMGLIRKDDFAPNAPATQATAVLNGLRRVQLLIETVKGLEGKLDGMQGDRLRRELAGLAGPKYLVSDSYGHCFVGSKESITRWAMDLERGILVHAQVSVGHRWERLHTEELDDLLGDLRVNEVRSDPSSFGAAWQNELPSWAPSSP